MIEGANPPGSSACTKADYGIAETDSQDVENTRARGLSTPSRGPYSVRPSTRASSIRRHENENPRWLLSESQNIRLRHGRRPVTYGLLRNPSRGPNWLGPTLRRDTLPKKNPDRNWCRIKLTCRENDSPVFDSGFYRVLLPIESCRYKDPTQVQHNTSRDNHNVVEGVMSISQ